MYWCLHINIYVGRSQETSLSLSPGPIMEVSTSVSKARIYGFICGVQMSFYALEIIFNFISLPVEGSQLCGMCFWVFWFCSKMPGLNCAEAVNFAPADWLPHGGFGAELYRHYHKAAVLSHEELLCVVAKVQLFTLLLFHNFCFFLLL